MSQFHHVYIDFSLYCATFLTVHLLWLRQEWIGDVERQYSAPQNPFHIMDAPDGYLWYRPRPFWARRLYLRLRERFGDESQRAALKAIRYDQLRPYMRTGACWWRPLFDQSGFIERFDVENLAYCKIRPTAHDEIWFSHMEYSDRVYANWCPDWWEKWL